MAEFVLNEFRGVFKRAEELYNEEKYKDAVPLFRDVVEHDKDNYIACYYLADCLYYAKGTSRDYKKAFELFMIAASNKLTEACYMVGLCYLEGTGINQDSTQAVAWFTEAAKYAHPLSQYYLGVAYMKGEGKTKDIPRAAQWLVHAAKEGIVDASRDAAICYEALGKWRGAATLYLDGAEKGESYCQERIGDCYADGLGTLQSFELAMHYYTLAAEQGNVKAMVKMANKYLSDTTNKDALKNAIHWYMKAANLGDADAQNSLAECYYTGNGIFQNYQNAILWWTKSANQGNRQAMIHLAENYAEPDDPVVQKDLKTAKFWWTKAAEAGDPFAMYKLGECYELGLGVPQANLDDAYKWYRLASQNGNEEATEAILKFTKSISGKIKIKKQK